MKETKTIYLDLDGVLVDWFTSAALEINNYMLMKHGELAIRLNKEFPKGYVTSDDMRKNFNPRANSVYYSEHNSWLPEAIESMSLDQSWWCLLPWTCFGKKILFECFNSGHNVIILTFAPDNESRIGKRLWVDENIDPEIRVMFDRDKHHYANKNTLLIDDCEYNISRFSDAGGKVFLVSTPFIEIELLLDKIKMLGEP